MPKKNRLSRADFQRMRGFLRLQGRYFSLSYGKIPGRSTLGAACIVSKKVAARAVARNRIKRQARSALSDLVRGAAPLVYVFVARKGASDASSREVRDDIEKLFARAR